MRIDAQLSSARRQLRQAQTTAIASLDQEKAALSERLLGEVRTAALSAISSYQVERGASAAVPLHSPTGPTLTARATLIRGVESYNAATVAGTGTAATGTVVPAAGSIAALSRRVRDLEIERSNLIRKNLPDPGTAGFRTIVSSLIAVLSQEGVDGKRLSGIGKSLGALPSSLSDNERMRTYISATGGDLSRPPRPDDLAGWRFLIDQAIESRWLSILLSPDLSSLAKALSTESDLLAPLSAVLATQFSRLASDIEAGGRAIASMRSYLPELYADLNAGMILVVVEREGSPSVAQRSLDEVVGALEKSFPRYVSDVRSIAPGRLAALIARDPLFESLAGDTARTLNVVDRAQMVRFVRATGTDGLAVRIATAVLGRAYHDGHNRELAQFADSTAAAPAAMPGAGQSYTRRLTDQAQKILQEADSALGESGDSQNRQWAFLSIMESRYAWQMLRSDDRFAPLRNAFDSYVVRIISDTDSLAASELMQSAPAGTPPGRVVVVPVVEYAPVFREVGAYRERVSNNGVVVRDEIPVQRVWAAYASAFFQVSQGRGASAGTGAQSAKDWALMHGQAAVNWQWNREEPNAQADVVMNERLLNTYLHGVTEENNRQLSDRVQFLRSVIAPWVDAVRSAPEFGSDAVSGTGTTPSSTAGVLPTAGILPTDRSWERFAMGFLMLRREIVQVLLSPIARFGFVPREILTDRERYTLELMNQLDALSLSAPEFFTRLSTAWLDRPMTQPDPADASALADAIVSGTAKTADFSVRHYTNAARAAAAVEFQASMTLSAGETAASYAERLFRCINSDADRSRISVGDFRLFRESALANVRRAADRTGTDRSAIARLLSELGLIRAEEMHTLEAPG